MRLRVATRGSDLALAQARRVAARIESALRVATEIVPIATTGDRLQSVRLSEVGGKGLFIKELEEALLDGRADLAVHSAKDLPAALPDGLALAAFPERADPRDALLGRTRGATLAGLRRGARVATGSVRRGAQLLLFRPDLEIVPIRGNVPTRLRKLEDEGHDALVLACAGLDRLGLEARIDERVASDVLLPAVAQGVIAIEARAGGALAADLSALDDTATSHAAAAERAFLAGLAGDCTVPLAALAEIEGARLRVRGLVATTDGRRVARGAVEVELGADAAGDAAAAGAELAARVRGDGGDVILRWLAEGAA